MIAGSGGGNGGGVTNPARDFTSTNVEPMFIQPTCFCGCCNIHQNSAQSANKAHTQRMGRAGGKQSQVLSFPDSKSPISSFNESRRLSITSSSATTWNPDFHFPGYPGFKSNETQQQPVGQMPQQHCCFPPMINGGSVEIVKVGEGPPLTWADLQRHGAIPFPDGDDWAMPIQSQRSQSIQQPSQLPSQKCTSWKIFNTSEPKRTPISDYNNWSQRKKSPQQACDVPHDFMVHQSSSTSTNGTHSKPVVSGMGCCCDQAKLTTTTAQTESSINYHLHHHHPMILTPYTYNQCPCGGQNLNAESWQNGDETNGDTAWRHGQHTQQKKFSLPPASHHSPEQRTSYRAKRVY